MDWKRWQSERDLDGRVTEGVLEESPKVRKNLELAHERMTWAAHWYRRLGEELKELTEKLVKSDGDPKKLKQIENRMLGIEKTVQKNGIATLKDALMSVRAAKLKMGGDR